MPLARSSRKVVFALVCFAFSTRTAGAGPRTSVDFEPVTPYFAGAQRSRTTVAMVGLTWGLPSSVLVPFAGVGIGLLAAEARAGALLLPAGLSDAGLLIRTEVRPEVLFANCAEPLLTGDLGIGYRWPMGYPQPDRPPQPAVFLLPQGYAGVGWLRDCKENAHADTVGRFVVGGTVALGMDW